MVTRSWVGMEGCHSWGGLCGAEAAQNTLWQWGGSITDFTVPHEQFCFVLLCSFYGLWCDFWNYYLLPIPDINPMLNYAILCSCRNFSILSQFNSVSSILCGHIVFFPHCWSNEKLDESLHLRKEVIGIWLQSCS